MSKTYNQQTIQELVRTQESNYISGSHTKISKYVDFDLNGNIEKIEAYINSKHITGDTDSMGREKPFFDIVTAAVNIWYRATDIDRKNIRIKATKEKDMFTAFVASEKFQQWMKRVKFATFLNKWGRTLAVYGSAVVKFVEKDGELYPMVMSWNRIIVDPVNMSKAPLIEVLELTKSELLKRKGYDKTMVKNLLSATEARESIDGQDVDDRADYIKLYEVHGELPLSMLTGKEEYEDDYVQQMQVISFVESKEKGQWDDFTLYSGREKKNPYMITHLIEEEGRTQSRGAVEYLFEAQWMQNHTAKQIKDQLDLASKLIFQTTDGNYVGQNALFAIESGDIMVTQTNTAIAQLANNSHDITALQNFGMQWRDLAKEMTSTPDSISGGTMPSGTAYRQVAILNQESHSLFEIMTENKGNHIEDMMREFIIPHIKIKIDTTDEIVSVLEGHNLKKIDTRFIKNTVLKSTKKKIIEALKKGEIPEGIDPTSEAQEMQAQMLENGNERFFIPSEEPNKTWKEVFKDLEWEVEVEVTPENTDKEVTLTTLSTVLATISSNPAILQDPNGRLIFNQILEETGRVSPIQIAQLEASPQAPTQQPPQTPAVPQFNT